jgi:hypothetical protein
MKDEEIREQCLEIITKAPTSTLAIMAEYLLSASHLAKPQRITTMIDWRPEGEITARDLLRFPINDTPYSLARYVWYHMIINQAIKVRDPNALIAKMFIDENWEENAKLQPWYQSSPARVEFESLCLNGCGEQRRESSPFCSERCYKTFWKWMKEQTTIERVTVSDQCFNGCGHSRRIDSEFCSNGCRNTLKKWVEKHSTPEHRDVIQNLYKKARNFKRALERQAVR